MSEQSQTVNAAAPAAETPPAPVPAPRTAAKKRKARRRVRRIIVTVIVLALLAAAGWAIWYFVFRDTVEQGELLMDTARIDMIQSKVEGSGNAVAKDMAAITVSASGTVQEVYVGQDEMVYEGQLLYTIVSPAAQEALAAAEKGVLTAEKGVLTAQEYVETAKEQVLQAQKRIGEAEKGVPAAEKALEEARNELAKRRQELLELQNGTSRLRVTAPFAGKLIAVEPVSMGDELGAGAVVATLANDRVMRLSLYFSYAYENSVYVGQSAQVSVPSMMLPCTGTVSEVHMVNRVVPEGAVLFEAVIDVPNPGVLTENIAATATLTAADGSAIYPYEDGHLVYAGTEAVKTDLAGPVLSHSLMLYADVSAGQVLLTQGADRLNEMILDKQQQIELAEQAVESAQERVEAAKEAVEDAVKGVSAAEQGVLDAEQGVLDAEQGVLDAQAKVEEAQKALEDLNAVAPIDGTIVSNTLFPGMDVRAGDTVITISNTAQMTVEITVDDRNIGFVTPGMMVELSDWSGNMWMGTVTNITMIPDMSGMGSGMTNYPITLTVDNYDGSLRSGMWLQYSFVASQSDDCVIVPIQSVKSTMDEEGNEIRVVFVQRESRPDNTVTMPEQSPDRPQKYPNEGEQGFYAVPVETGLSDTYNVEIKSGLEAGDVVFTNYMSASGYYYGW